GRYDSARAPGSGRSGAQTLAGICGGERYGRSGSEPRDFPSGRRGGTFACPGIWPQRFQNRTGQADDSQRVERTGGSGRQAMSVIDTVARIIPDQETDPFIGREGYVGQSLDRVDGHVKVKGEAQFT